MLFSDLKKYFFGSAHIYGEQDIFFCAWNIILFFFSFEVKLVDVKKKIANAIPSINFMIFILKLIYFLYLLLLKIFMLNFLEADFQI